MAAPAVMAMTSDAPMPVTDAGQANAPRCGNGVLDDGEMCDIAIADGKSGRMPDEVRGRGQMRAARE